MQLAGMLILGGIGTTGWPLEPRFQAVTIVMLCLITAGFSIGFAPLANVVTTEITSLHLRDMTQRIACCMNVIAKYVILQFPSQTRNGISCGDVNTLGLPASLWASRHHTCSMRPTRTWRCRLAGCMRLSVLWRSSSFGFSFPSAKARLSRRQTGSLSTTYQSASLASTKFQTSTVSTRQRCLRIIRKQLKSFRSRMSRANSEDDFDRPTPEDTSSGHLLG